MGQVAEFVANHPFLVAGLLGAWALVMLNEIRLKSQGLGNISNADAVRLINRGAVVIDVREPEAYRHGHIANARNVQMAELQANPDALKRQKKKVLLAVCENGATSAKAAGMLRKAGYEKVFSLKGGLSGWRSDNLPLVK
jgi:rhodanese-related sulfurtransferase